MENQEAAEWQAPLPPEKIQAPEQPEMSEVATIGNIFFEPGRTFEDLRRKPRVILATVIISLLVGAYGFALAYKVGDTNIRQFFTEQLENSAQGGSMNSEAKTRMVDMQMTGATVGRFISPLIIAIFMVIGGLLYWAGGKAFGGSGGFLHGWSVFLYSSLPPAVVGTIANFIVMAFKSVSEIDFATSQRTLIHASPAFFLNAKSAPVLATLVGTLDLFMIWGWILAAIGLRITNKISSGSAWAIVILIGLLGVVARVVGAFISGTPT